MKNWPKWLKWTLGIVGGLITIGGLALWLNSDPLPEGKQGPAADALAEKMMKAVNKPAWDSTTYVQWTFKGMHTFLWDKERHLTIVEWKNNKVILDINNISGKAWKDGNELPAEQAKPIVKKAWEYWCNDAFWLNAPVKAFDGGTERRLVEMEDGSEALLITYKSGGVTPGDSYLWILDEKGLPKEWRMWVSIIPMGGVTFSWEKWTDLTTGAKIATFHDSKMIDLDISNLKGSRQLSDFGYEQDPFQVIVP